MSIFKNFKLVLVMVFRRPSHLSLFHSFLWVWPTFALAVQNTCIVRPSVHLLTQLWRNASIRPTNWTSPLIFSISSINFYAHLLQRVYWTHLFWIRFQFLKIPWNQARSLQLWTLSGQSRECLQYNLKPQAITNFFCSWQGYKSRFSSFQAPFFFPLFSCV